MLAIYFAALEKKTLTLGKGNLNFDWLKKWKLKAWKRAKEAGGGKKRKQSIGMDVVRAKVTPKSRFLGLIKMKRSFTSHWNATYAIL